MTQRGGEKLITCQCKICGKVFDARRHRQTCDEDCKQEFLRRVHHQLRTKRGEYYEKWAYRMRQASMERKGGS
jgi:hypothetical protein